jgi:hypothetical protein
MGPPNLMIRFRDENNPAVVEHNIIFEKNGRVLWGLWLKSFENKDEIATKLRSFEGQSLYVADTESKARPSIYLSAIKNVVIGSDKIDPSLVPDYYREKIAEVPIWFELTSKISEIHANPELCRAFRRSDDIFS